MHFFAFRTCLLNFSTLNLTEAAQTVSDAEAIRWSFKEKKLFEANQRNAVDERAHFLRVEMPFSATVL